MSAVHPRGMALRDYFDSLVYTVDGAWSFGRLDDDDWQTYAMGFVRASNLSQRLLPNPYAFDDWREWGERVYLMLEGTDAG